MIKDIQLYINGLRVDLDEKSSGIKWNYEVTDYSNPSILKNPFTKSITILGTPTNDHIFGEIFQLNRTMDSNFTLFNPSQRADFELFKNGELVEKGYCKLETIKTTSHKFEREYTLNLFGSMGDFLYKLSYDEGEDKEKTLMDLNYMGTLAPDDEFNFEINKDTIHEAWTHLGQSNAGTEYEIWDYINFAPCYNKPEDFDCNRVLINTQGLGGMAVRYTTDDGLNYSTFPFTITDGEGNRYTTKNGYLEGEFRRDMSEWEVADLRSHSQRPVLSVKKLIQAICNPINNGGYQVDLDQDFFRNPNNPYNNLWMTLPLLDVDNDSEDETYTWEWSVGDKYPYHGSGVNAKKTGVKWQINSVTPIVGTPDSYVMDVEVHATITGTSANKLYMSTYCNNGADPEDPEAPPPMYYWGAVLMQLYGYGDGQPWSSQTGKCGSNLICLTSRLGNDYIGQNTINTWFERAYADSDVQYIFGYWKKVSGSDYVWHNEEGDDNIKVVMDTNLLSMIPNLGLSWGHVMTLNGALVDSLRGYCFNSLYYDYASSMNNGKYRYNSNISLEDLGSYTLYKSEGNMRSFKDINKRILLGGIQGTPADFFVSFLKIFGLHLFTDRVEKKIYVRLRKNFYTGSTIDISDKVDVTNMEIKPLAFDSKWYSLSYTEGGESEFITKYEKNYDAPYGRQLIDTQYSFDSEKVDLLEGLSYKNGVACLEKSNYFNLKYDPKGFRIPQTFYDWVTVKYFNDDGSYETNMTLPPNTHMDFYNPYTPNEFYDVVPKLQCHDEDDNGTDGSCILLFFNGIKSTDNVDYYITDDLAEMFDDGNTNPCFLCTVSEWNYNWTNVIAKKINYLPEFNRYVLHNSTIPYPSNPKVMWQTITCSLDFGRVKELFIPYYKYDQSKTPTIYENFHKSYYNDVMSVDTRIVDAKVVFNENDVYEALRHFYWFSDSIWVLNKITEYDFSSNDLVKCSFTKVQDVDNYTSTVTFDDYFFDFRRVNGSGNVPFSGTSDELSVDFVIDSSSEWYVIVDEHNFVSFLGGNANSVQGDAGTNLPVRAVFGVNRTSSPRTAIFYGINMETHAVIQIPITQDCWENSSHLFLSTAEYPLPSITTGATYMVLVYSSDPWESNCEASWVHIQTPTGATGEGVQFLFTCDTNTAQTRYAVVKFSNGVNTAEFKIIQAEKGMASIEQSVDERITIPASGGSINYVIKNDYDWELVPQGSSSAYTHSTDFYADNAPTNEHTTTINIDPNTSTVSRNIMMVMEYNSTILKPSRQPLPLVQEGSGNTVLNLGSGATSGYFYNGAELPWTATTNDSWITITTTSGTSAETRNEILVTSNSGSSRQGVVTVSYIDEYGYPVSEQIIIKQGGDIGFDVYPTALTVSDRVGTYMVNVSASTDYSATTKEDWIILDTTEGLNFRTFSVTANSAETARVGSIRFTDGNSIIDVMVTQNDKYGNGVIALSPSATTLDSTSGVGTVIVKCLYDWSLSTSANWLTLNASSGNGNTIVSYSYDDNTSSARSTTIVAETSSITATANITQEGHYLYVSESEVILGLNSRLTYTVNVNSNVDWEASTDESWISLSPASGNGNGRFVITAESGDTFRYGDVLISNDEYGLNHTICVLQKGNNIILYTTTDNNLIGGVYGTTGWGARMVDFYGINNQGKTIGVIEFDGDVTTIIPFAFGNSFVKTNLQTIEIPESVTDISLGAFYNSKLEGHITLPNNLEHIGVSAFSETFITGVTFPQSLLAIEQLAFSNTQLTGNVTIPDNVTVIDKNAFAYNENITEVTIGRGITNIKELVFYGCTSLEVITLLSPSITTIYRGAFGGNTSLKEVYCYSLTAPTFDMSPFSSSLTDVTVHYPHGSDYSYWQDYLYTRDWTYIDNI